jgi:hypothetical protein
MLGIRLENLTLAHTWLSGNAGRIAVIDDQVAVVSRASHGFLLTG